MAPRSCCIDPKRIRIAEQSHLHLQIQPGTDVVLAMAVAAELERRGAIDNSFVEKWAHGFDEYMAQARQYDVANVESICGLTESEFNQFVEYYVQAQTVAVSIGNGIERGHSGGSGLRAAMALQVLTGNHGRLGAGVIAKPGWVVPKTADRLQRPDLIPDGTRTFNIVDVPELVLDDQLDPPIKAMLIFNHNPVATHPDQVKMIEALQREDLFIVGSDIVMTDSMKYADVILPAASHFEYDDVYGAYGQNYVQRAAPAISCVGESLPNTEIFRRLAARFGFEEAMFRASDKELMDDAIDGTDVRLKGYMPSEIPLDEAIEFNSLSGEANILCKNVVPATPSGKIELCSQNLENQYGFGVPRYRHVEKDLPLTLISPSSSKRTNATFGGCAESQQYEVLEMNPVDAAERGLESGDLVTVWNQRGKVSLELLVTDATRPGVLYSAKGNWLNTSDTGLTVNSLIPADIRADIERGACYNETFVDVSVR